MFDTSNYIALYYALKSLSLITKTKQGNKLL